MTLESELTRAPAHRLAELLARREVSSEEVTRAHLERIEQLEPTLRAFTEVFHRRALDDARAADAARAAGEARGPLMGLPMTFKECLDVRGLATTIGVPARLAHRASEDAVVLALAREQGAVVLGRTNLSQLMLFHESRNPIFGQTSNPWSLRHTPGGSSGGEAAALASGMSPLGVGTDIGGSIRTPCHFCGVAGLKPTLDRWSVRGVATAMAGQEAVRGTVGPMGRTARDVAFLMTALDPRAMAIRDPRVPPLPFEDPSRVELRGLRVGLHVDDGVLRPSVAIERALEVAAAALAARGCEVVRFSPPRIADAVVAYFAALSSDGSETLTRLMGPHRPDAVLASLQRMARLPGRVRRAAARVARLAKEPLLARVLEGMGEKRVADYWVATNVLRAYRFELHDAMDREAIDLVLCPPHATPALLHGGSKDFAFAGAPSMLWNIVQFPAGVVPVTRVRVEEASRPGARGVLERRAAEVDRASAGLPVGVQLVARPYREDLVVAAMLAVEDEVRGDPEFPVTPVTPATRSS